MEVHLRQLSSRDRGQPDLFTFPLPPTTAVRIPSSRTNVEYLKFKLGRSPSLLKKPKSIDINITSIHHQSPRRNESLSPPYTASSYSQSPKKDLLPLPRLPQDPAPDAQSPAAPLVLSEDMEVTPAKAAKTKCARYPITYKLRTNLTLRQPLPAHRRSVSVSRVKSLYDEPGVCEPRPSLGNYSSPDLSNLTSASASASDQQHQPSVASRQDSSSCEPPAEAAREVVPPPRSASLHCLAKKPLSPRGRSRASTVNRSPIVRGNCEEGEMEAIQTAYINMDNESDHTAFSHKSGVLDRPRPLGRARGQSFSNHSAEFDKIMKLQASGSSIKPPGRVRPPPIPSISTPRPSSILKRQSNGTPPSPIDFHSHHTHRHSQSLSGDGPLERESLFHAQRASRASRRSFFSSLARLDSDGISLNLNLELPSTPPYNTQGQDQAGVQMKNRKNRPFGGNKLKKNNSSQKPKGSFFKQDKHESDYLLPTLPGHSPSSPATPVHTGCASVFAPKSSFHKLRRIASLRCEPSSFSAARPPQSSSRRTFLPFLEHARLRKPRESARCG